MKRAISLIVFMMVVSASAMAQEQKPAVKNDGLMGWLKALQRKVEQLSSKRTIPVSTNVAGIRGAKEDEKAKLYWKGKKGDESVTDEELTAFKSAVDLAASGDNPSAAKALEQFIAKFPDSPFLPDAKKTLDMVKSETKEPGAASAPAPSPNVQ